MKITPEKNKESNDIDDSPRKEIENRDLTKERLSWSHLSFDWFLSG